MTAMGINGRIKALERQVTGPVAYVERFLAELEAGGADTDEAIARLEDYEVEALTVYLQWRGGEIELDERGQALGRAALCTARVYLHGLQRRRKEATDGGA